VSRQSAISNLCSCRINQIRSSATSTIHGWIFLATPLYASRFTLFHPCQRPNNFPLIVATRSIFYSSQQDVIFLFEQRVFLAVCYYSSSRLSRSSSHSPVSRGWKLKEGMVDTTRNVEWSGCICSKDHSLDARPYENKN